MFSGLFLNFIIMIYEFVYVLFQVQGLVVFGDLFFNGGNKNCRNFLRMD